MFLFLLSLATEEDLVEKIDLLESAANKKYDELYSIQKELDNIKTQDSKLRNRLSYIANSKTTSYHQPTLKKAELSHSSIIRPKMLSKTYSIEYFNKENGFIKSFHIDFKDNGIFPNEFQFDLYVSKEKIEFPKLTKQMETTVVLPSPVQASKVVLSWEKPRNIEEDPDIPSVSCSFYPSS